MELFAPTPVEVSKILAKKIKDLRLTKKWKRSTLANRSGVTESSLRRFEETGKVSMENFLKLMCALGRLDEMDALLKPQKALTIKDLETNENKVLKRGTL